MTCPKENQVINPVTGRCIDKKRLKKLYGIDVDQDVGDQLKRCPKSTQVVNPRTGHCIDKKRLDAQIKKLAKIVENQPVAKQPVAKQPVAKQPVAKQPVAKQPIKKHYINPQHLISSLSTQQVCKKPPRITKLKQNNTKLVAILRTMCDEWVRYKNIDKLIEANYLVDFYCSSLVVMCDKIYKLEQTSMVWLNKDKTYDHMILKLDYATGLQMVNQLYDMIASICIDNLRIHPHMPITLRSKVFHDKKVADWNTLLEYIPLSQVMEVVQSSIQSVTRYYASSWGMYRLINMNYRDNIGNIVSDYKPCSCICNSLLHLGTLGRLGFPSEYLFTHKQTDRNTYKNYRKKLTHWGVACQHPYKNILETYYSVDFLDILGNQSMVSIEGFTLYSRDIIFYFKSAIQFYNVGDEGPTKRHRTIVLFDLLDKYDKEFGRHLKTPI